MQKCYVVFQEFYGYQAKVVNIFSNRQSAIDFCNKENENSPSEFIYYFFEAHELND